MNRPNNNHLPPPPPPGGMIEHRTIHNNHAPPPPPPNRVSSIRERQKVLFLVVEHFADFLEIDGRWPRSGFCILLYSNT